MSNKASDTLQESIRLVMNAKSAQPVERIQSLWSGYGAIWRFSLKDAAVGRVVVKEVNPPNCVNHPRGWSSDISHARKMRSYEVERFFYENYSRLCDDLCRVPQVHHLTERSGRFLFILEDLDDAGFSERRHHLTDDELSVCLKWLADFHARFMGQEPKGLWDVGCYWHLETRPDEWAQMGDPCLKKAATAIDQKLNAARYQTLVHGDAKVANFCFKPRCGQNDGTPVAAVDFQYVGGGCGMKDVAYFLSSCLDEGQCESQAERWLAEYFGFLQEALRRDGGKFDGVAIENEWRELYPIAWADFLRFLDGWAPGHYKVHGYSKKMAQLALDRIDKQS